MTNIITKGTAGIGATGASLFVSLQPQIESGLRITSLIVGITVGLLTCRSLLKKSKE